jgi:hypothetical protein
MSEQVHEYSDPKQELIVLLQMDFTSPSTEAWAQKAVAEDDALAGLLANVRSIEAIDARLSSEENAELGRAVDRLVEPAPVTNSFKGFIVNEVRQAHAWESKASDAVAPDRLGLLSGDGIFDPAQAQDIEAHALRGYAFDIVRTYTVAPDKIGEDNLPHLLLRPSVRPSDYAESLGRLQEWGADYKSTYGEDALASIDPRAFIDTAGLVRVMTEEEAEEGGWNDLFERLQELRDEGEQA